MQLFCVLIKENHFDREKKIQPWGVAIRITSYNVCYTKLLRGMAQALGGNALGGLASLGSAFGALGLNADMIQQFIPVILEYVKGSGGEDVMKLLEGSYNFV